MKRLMIIGSSHCAALKLGWDAIGAAHTDWEVSFHALPGKTFRKAQINEAREFGVLDPTRIPAEMQASIRDTLGGDSIPLGEADAVLNVGWYLHETEHARLLGHYAIDGCGAPQGDGGPVSGPALPPMSGAAYAACLASLASHALPAAPWRQWSQPALFVLPQPRPAASCLSGGDDPLYTPWQGFARAHPTGGALLTRYINVVRAAFEKVGVHLLQPPESVWDEAGLTLAEYARQAPKLDGIEEYPDNDHYHMNKTYGEIVLKSVFSQIEAKLSSKE